MFQEDDFPFDDLSEQSCNDYEEDAVKEPDYYDPGYDEEDPDYPDCDEEEYEEDTIVHSEILDDDICTECDGEGTLHGHLCKACQGSGKK